MTVLSFLHVFHSHPFPLFLSPPPAAAAGGAAPAPPKKAGAAAVPAEKKRAANREAGGPFAPPRPRPRAAKQLRQPPRSLRCLTLERAPSLSPPPAGLVVDDATSDDNSIITVGPRPRARGAALTPAQF